MSTPASTRPCSDEDLLACYDLVFCLPGVSPSSRGPGRGPFKAKTRVRIPLGTYQLPRSRSVVERPHRSLGKRGAALHAPPAVPNPVGDATSFCELSATVKYLNALAVTAVRTNSFPSNTTPSGK